MQQRKLLDLNGTFYDLYYVWVDNNVVPLKYICIQFITITHFQSVHICECSSFEVEYELGYIGTWILNEDGK